MSTAIATAEETQLALAIAVEASLAVPEVEGSAVPEEGQGGGFPYVGFYGEKAKPDTRAPLDAVGIKVGEFYLHHIEPIRVVPFTLHLLKFGRLFTKQNTAMKITDAKTKSTQADFDAGYREHLFAVVAVRLPSPSGITFVPALLTARGGQSKILGKAIDLLPFATNKAAWSARSEAHAKSAVAKYPGGRFVVAISSTQEDLKDGSGNTFNQGHSNVKPTPEAEALAFNAWVDGAFPHIARVIALNDERIAEAKKKNLRS